MVGPVGKWLAHSRFLAEEEVCSGGDGQWCDATGEAGKAMDGLVEPVGEPGQQHCADAGQ